MENNVSIAFVGDITPGGVFTREGGISDEVLDYLRSFDIRIGTLESAFGDGTTLCHIKMADPNFATCIYSPDKMVSMLKDMQIDAISLANNHSCDCDLEGLYHTIELLDKAGISHFGAGRNQDETSAPAILKHKGKTICLLGYLQEYKYLYRGEGYHPTKDVGGLNIFNIEKAISDIKKYKTLFDYVFVMPHWGMERSMIPLYDEVNDAKRMVEAGADGIVGSHAHIVQPYFNYKGRIIAMNMGNFAFPDRYVIPPRLPYYPNDEELSTKRIPIIRSFKLVKELSLKVVASPERTGAILGLKISGLSQSASFQFTRLTNKNVISFWNVSSAQKRKLNFYKFLASGRLSFLLAILNLKSKAPYIAKDCLQYFGLIKK